MREYKLFLVKFISTLQEETIKIADAPNQCPHCARFIEPLERSGVCYTYLVEENDHDGKIFFDTGAIIFQCPVSRCERLFVAYFKQHDYYLNDPIGFYFKPIMVSSGQKFSAHIEKISPRFCDIYNQSLTAQGHQLDDVAGGGYRKSLEFLIRDYLIYNHPEEEAAILSITSLQKLIQEKVTDPNIKDCAERATWLGNDQVHYSVKWDSHTIEDLKALIGLVTGWIEQVEATKMYIARMSKGQK
jgi:hypothetical protein